MSASQARRSSQTDSQEQTTPPPSYKRRRIALACTSCRNRKSRCNGAKPSCSLCVELGFECVYQQPAASHVKAPQTQSGYNERLRAIEDTLRLLVQQKAQSLEGLDPSHDTHHRHQDFHVAHRASIRAPNDDEDVAILDEDDSLQQNAVEDSVDGMAAITDPEEIESRFFGPSSNIAFLRHISDATSATLKTIGQSRHSENGLNQPIVSRAASPVTTLSETSPTARQHVNIRSLPSESRALHLIRLFFSDTGMLFPYIHEQDILRSYSAARRNRFTSVGRSWLCLLNVIFAFATYISARPDQPAEKNAAESEIFIERAQALSADIELKSANLETVQCLLLMAQYRQGTQRSDQAWSLHGLAVRAAIQLGLHSKSASSGLSSIEAEIRKRTWFGCMILDRTLSMTFGRPATIPNDYLKLDLPVNQNLEKLTMMGSSAAVSSLDPPDTVCLFIATIQLYFILGDIISQLYGSNVDADPQLTIPTMLERTLILEQQLTAWKRSLFPQLQRRPWDTLDPEPMLSSTWDPVFDRLSVIITLRYLNTRILLHRPILSAFLRRRAYLRNGGDIFEEGDSFFHDVGKRSIQICQQSAVEVVDIVHKTSKPPALLGAWWFSAYYTFNAALAIFSCILLEITASNSWTPNGPPITTRHPLDSSKVIEMITRLRRAVETLQRLGEGTRSAKRIRKTLLKLVQICMTLAQCSPEHGPTILSALSASQQSGAAQMQGQNGLALQPHNEATMDGSVDTNCILPPIAADDPFAALDVGMYQYWTDNNLDLFTDLVGIDTGLTAMMAG
ncbi:uncharacterized protein Z518_09512 [Rhinocladiella mackenziei CBS 650.93]|uniref:Zn(2)-C6 fungal-type domain-containing protein n=1 Tax=Rhinocladiella mackenziei CBS 650.93 TaxID=1442369 RepID=A0A0D2IYS9_9EURO|nr:uncharacterized protein Z518_09512 [Rhinocladiella mackenziei CBS 650.93]KIX01785.1 hypothetical protein Z518_09512 [Rhinocladiella mackenziei CBS 650.93]